jgi:exonuclease III
MFKRLLFLSLFAFSVLADTECPYITDMNDNRVDKNKMRLVQYNVEWLFTDYYSAMDCPGNGCTWNNASEADKHMDYVATRIADLNPDIINLCEVEGCDELKQLNAKLNNTFIPYLKKGTDTATGQNVGMLTRIDPVIDLYRNELKYTYPIPDSTCGYKGSTSSSGVSKHYITEFEFNGLQVAFISAHLLAIPTDPTRCSEREAQASVLQSVIYGFVERGLEVIMLGDFNDYDAEVLDKNGNKPTSKVLDILKGLHGDYKGKYLLHNVAEELVKSERYSDWWDSDNNCDTSSPNDYSMIDHILVTDLIRKNIIDVFIYHAYDEYCGKYDSDHYPVVIDLAF